MTSFYLHKFVDFYFSISLPFPSSNLLLLGSSVQGCFCKAVWIWNHIKGGTHQVSPGLLKYVTEVVCTWSHHQHRELARICQILLKQLLLKLYLLKAATALIILFRADLSKQITSSKWKRITTLYCCAGGIFIFQTFYTFLSTISWNMPMYFFKFLRSKVTTKSICCLH